MKRICWSVAILFACVFAAQSQSRPVKVHIHVMLVDSELNQKPVPFLTVTLKGAATSTDVKTRLDGTPETTLPPGAYTVTTAKRVESTAGMALGRSCARKRMLMRRFPPRTQRRGSFMPMRQRSMLASASKTGLAR